MEARVYVDTHVIVWLRDGELSKLSPEMASLCEQSPLYFSEFARLELQYLYEIKRLREPANEIIMYLTERIGLQACDMLLSRIMQESLMHRWTRDPFDRLITANASLFGAPLLTRDGTIGENYKYAVC